MISKFVLRLSPIIYNPVLSSAHLLLVANSGSNEQLACHDNFFLIKIFILLNFL
jgi:hypothetical protein